MSAIEIKKSTFDMIEGMAILPFRDTSRPLPNGNVEIDISEHAAVSLSKIRHDGESYDDTVRRLIERLQRPTIH